MPELASSIQSIHCQWLTLAILILLSVPSSLKWQVPRSLRIYVVNLRPLQIVPVRCFSCGKVVGHLWEVYITLLAADQTDPTGKLTQEMTEG